MDMSSIEATPQMDTVYTLHAPSAYPVDAYTLHPRWSLWRHMALRKLQI